MYWLADVFTGAPNGTDYRHHDQRAHVERTRALPPGIARAIRSMRSVLQGTWDRVVEQRRTRLALFELNGLNDRLLWDIGLIRADVTSVTAFKHIDELAPRRRHVVRRAQQLDRGRGKHQDDLPKAA